MVTVSSEGDKKISYNDLLSANATQIVLQSLGISSSCTTYAAWKDTPSTFLIGDLDQSTLSPEVIEMVITEARKTFLTSFAAGEHCREGGH